MKTIIRDDKGNEEIMQDDKDNTPITIAYIVVAIIFGYIISSIAPVVIILILISLPLFVWDERIIFDKGIKSVIIEKRRVADKKIKWKETKKIKFSDIAKITVELWSDNEGGAGPGFGFDTYLTTVGGMSKTVLEQDYEKDAKESAIKLCKTAGVNGYYIDYKKNSTPLIEAT